MSENEGPEKRKFYRKVSPFLSVPVRFNASILMGTTDKASVEFSQELEMSQTKLRSSEYQKKLKSSGSCVLTKDRTRTGHSQKIVPGLEAFNHVRNVKPGPERSEGSR